jgi:hypothetical protein
MRLPPHHTTCTPQLSRQLLAGGGAPRATSGLLADTLHLLAVGLQDAPQRARQDLCLKLLLLFSDVATRVGGKSGVVTGDLGDLLVAVAVASEGLEPRTLRLLSGGSSSSCMSIHELQVGRGCVCGHDRRVPVYVCVACVTETAPSPVPPCRAVLPNSLQRAQREDACSTRLFRNLWLYTAMHQLVTPAAAVSAAAGSSSSSSGGMAAEWQLAAGRLAAVSPLLVVGTDSYIEADMVERLKVCAERRGCAVPCCGNHSGVCCVQRPSSHTPAPCALRCTSLHPSAMHRAQIELGEQVSQAGSLGSVPSLTATLHSLLGGKAGLAAQQLPQPTELVLLAFIVAVAISELSRAALAPLPDLGEQVGG